MASDDPNVIGMNADIATALTSTMDDETFKKEVEAIASRHGVKFKLKDEEFLLKQHHIALYRTKLAGDSSRQFHSLGAQNEQAGKNISASSQDFMGQFQQVGQQMMQQGGQVAGQLPQMLQGVMQGGGPLKDVLDPSKVMEQVQKIVQESVKAAGHGDSGGDDDSKDQDDPAHAHHHHAGAHVGRETPVTLTDPTFTVNPSSSAPSGQLGFTPSSTPSDPNDYSQLRF